jgi:hypothetical protein
MRLLKLLALLASMTAVVAAAAQADPLANIQAVLRPAAEGPDKGFGLVKFRQPKDGATIVYLDAWVRDLAPDHSYYLERAVDPPNMTDGNCDNETSWLRLGQAGSPTVPTAIETDERGTGRAALSRNVPAPPGMEFDIHFRVVDAVNSAVVLESACYQFAVTA